MFDSTPMTNRLESEPNSHWCCFEMVDSINQKHDLRDIVFLAASLQKLSS